MVTQKGEAMNQTAITIYDRLAEQNAMQAVEMMGNAIARCGMFGVTKPEQGIVLALTSLMERRSVTELARQFHIIEGKLTMRADAMQAAFQADTGRITWITTTETECVAEFIHPEYCPDGVTVRITLDELRASGVAIGRGGELKTNYQKFPRQMLRARVISEGVRMVDPSVLVGVYTPEEVSDFGEQRPVRPIQDAEYQPVLKPRGEIAAPKRAEELIPADKQEATVAYLQNIGWLAAGEKLADLKAGHLRQIQEKTDRFLAAVENWEAQNNE
jgi:hypothetical protein